MGVMISSIARAEITPYSMEADPKLRSLCICGGCRLVLRLQAGLIMRSRISCIQCENDYGRARANLAEGPF